ncbi:MAG: alpha-L-fucosidase [Mangrovibacterium sp.]
MFQDKDPLCQLIKALQHKFNPKKFNAEEWVKLAREAGQKYIVIVSKHHDGFANVQVPMPVVLILLMQLRLNEDPLKELADACKKHDMKLGFYYSQAQDWYHPGGAHYDSIIWDEAQKGDMNKYIDNIAIPQVKEILENYGEVAVLWWDTPLFMSDEMCQKLANLLKPYPKIISNDRLGPKNGRRH